MATLHAGRKVREEAILENGGKAMAITDSTTTGELGIDSERVVRDVLERFRDAYDRRDVDGAVELFADDAVLVFAPRTFNGKDEIRHGLEWDAKLSPTSRTRLSGIEVLAKGVTIQVAVPGTSVAVAGTSG
jgi:ketosteroid isomerase-like protein